MHHEQYDEALAVLTNFDQQFAALIEMVQPESLKLGLPRHFARQALRQLKIELGTVASRLHRLRDELNVLESHFVEPAVRSAASKLTIRIEIDACSEWELSLVEARAPIASALVELRAVTPGWSPGD